MRSGQTLFRRLGLIGCICRVIRRTCAGFCAETCPIRVLGRPATFQGHGAGVSARSAAAAKACRSPRSVALPRALATPARGFLEPQFSHDKIAGRLCWNHGGRVAPVQPLLHRTPRQSVRDDHRLCGLGKRKRDRGLPLCHRARRADGDGRDGAVVFPRGCQAAWRRPADLDVPVFGKEPVEFRRFPAQCARQRRVAHRAQGRRHHLAAAEQSVPSGRPLFR